MSARPLLPWLAEPLAQALQAERSHALLIHGPKGVGQFELAFALASAWLCETPAADRPQRLACSHCEGCHLVAARTHPDLLVLLPEALQAELGWGTAEEGEGDERGSKRKPSQEIRVEAVRTVVAFAQQTSARGGPKVALFYPAERINATAANMLLKTLEEPPGRTRFLLASAAPQRLLPTVRSRCQALGLRLPPAELASTWLADQQAIQDPELLLAAAGGAPLAALERLGQGIDAPAWERLPSEIAAGRATTLAGWPLPLAIDALQKFCHDLLAAAVGAPPRYFRRAAVPGGGDLHRLNDCAKHLRDAARHAEHPLNAALAVEALVLQLRRAMPGARP